VFRQTVEGGFINGVYAFRQRNKKCRKGYQLYTSKNGFQMKLADGSVINENEISPRILEPIYKQVKEYSIIKLNIKTLN